MGTKHDIALCSNWKMNDLGVLHQIQLIIGTCTAIELSFQSNIISGLDPEMLHLRTYLALMFQSFSNEVQVIGKPNCICQVEILLFCPD